MYDELKKLAEKAGSAEWIMIDGDGGIEADSRFITSERRILEVKIPFAEIHYGHPAAGMLEPFQGEQVAAAAFIAAANPSAVLALIAEVERLKREEKNDAIAYKAAIERQEELRAEFKEWQASHHANYCKAADERDQLKAENEVARMRIKELDLLFGRYILAMRSALIEEEHGLGPEAGMMWIYNSLVGPGELPPEDATNAQSYFDAEIVAIDKGMAEIMEFYRSRRRAKEVAK